MMRITPKFTRSIWTSPRANRRYAELRNEQRAIVKAHRAWVARMEGLIDWAEEKEQACCAKTMQWHSTALSLVM
jgi:hypothetical protein